jgi:hypothetical protein
MSHYIIGLITGIVIGRFLALALDVFTDYRNGQI